MAIDPLQETLITLTQAAELFPRSRSGKRVHCSVLYRYTSRGIRGVRLESLQAGGKRCTSREAVARFFARLTDTAMGRRQAEAGFRAAARGRRTVERQLQTEGL